MKSLPPTSGKEVIKVLRITGFKIVRQRGSHIRLEKKTLLGTFKLTVPDHKVLKRRTLKTILKQAGLPNDEFLKLLKG